MRPKIACAEIRRVDEMVIGLKRVLFHESSLLKRKQLILGKKGLIQRQRRIIKTINVERDADKGTSRLRVEQERHG